MKICPTCNKEFPDDQKFCKYDGTPLAEKKAEAESSKKCPKCGRTYPADAGFCMTCGAKLVALGEKNVCASCGAELPEGAAFCMKCGAKAGQSGESVEEKISTRNLSEIDAKHLEKYDIATLCWLWNSNFELRDKADDFIKAEDVLTEEKKSNDKDLQYWLGSYYEKIGEDKNAFVYYQKAAKQGLEKAMSALSCCYRYGTGCKQDFYKEFEWAKKSGDKREFTDPFYIEEYFAADCKIDGDTYIFQHLKIGAENGLEEAYVKLADCYKNGTGCKKNDYEAFRWYKAAADRGDAWANYSLAGYYDEGKVCKQDDYEAFRCMKIAADSDASPAKFFLGAYLMDGSGCNEDLEEGLRLIKESISELENDADNTEIREMIEAGREILGNVYCTIQGGNYYYRNGKITITADRVNNVSDSQTRNLELVLWLTNSPHKYGGDIMNDIDGKFIAEHLFYSGLKKGFGFTDINWTADVEISSAIPHGEYYVVLTVNEESEDGESCPIVGWKNFERKIRI